MCGRFSQADLEQLDREILNILEIPSFEARYNVAPTQDAAIIREGPRGRTVELLRWGLIPSWADDPKMAARTINARAETLATKPAFRDSFRSRRCIVPASGFYEWKKTGSKKQPFYIHPSLGRHFFLAGLWDRWFSNVDGPIESFTIATTDANDALREIHDRMPVVLSANDIDQWLDPAYDNAARLEALLRPAPDSTIAMYPVSTFVNAVANEGPTCIAPLVGS